MFGTCLAMSTSHLTDPRHDVAVLGVRWGSHAHELHPAPPVPHPPRLTVCVCTRPGRLPGTCTAPLAPAPASTPAGLVPLLMIIPCVAPPRNARRVRRARGVNGPASAAERGCASRFWFYGDDPVEERLQRLGAYLDTYEARTDINSLVPNQPLFSEPRKFVGYYAAGDAEVCSCGGYHACPELAWIHLTMPGCQPVRRLQVAWCSRSAGPSACAS